MFDNFYNLLEHIPSNSCKSLFYFGSVFWNTVACLTSQREGKMSYFVRILHRYDTFINA